MTSPRQIRFVMDKNIYEKWYFNKFFKMLNMIPISPRVGRSSLEEIAKALDSGDMVCIFPEGAISRNGHFGEFKKGFEKILEMTTVEVHVMPFYIRGLWGDISSRNSGREYKKDSLLKNRDVSVHYGEKITNNNAINTNSAVSTKTTVVEQVKVEQVKLDENESLINWEKDL
jgi:acyl-[acyl-carrier-protein]-phospholipid O-acyltransferase/long-chain-fatty-acid--[acyl-carrier-protein] ligase